MRRYALRDDQWDRIKDLLPGREGHAGVTATDNRLFVEGCRKCGWTARQFPLNLKGCLGSGLCNLGCPNLAKQGTHRVQLPNAEASGVEVVTRAEALTSRP